MNGATFWAQKRDIVKSTDSPPAAVQPPQQTQPVPKKSGLILKDITNGKKVSQFSGRKTDWADSDEDEDFLNSFGSKQDSQVATLHSTVASKDAQIDELKAVIAVKDVRIEELEVTVQGKVAELLHLEPRLTEQTEQLEQLRSENNEQYLHVNELVAEMDEKSREIASMEADIEVAAHVIYSLELEVKKYKPGFSLGDLEKLEFEKITPTKDQVKKVEEVDDRSTEEPAAVETIQPDVSTADEPLKADESVKIDEHLKSPQPKESVKEVADAPAKSNEPVKVDEHLQADEPIKAASPQYKESSKKKSKADVAPGSGPKFGDSEFPLFVTPATLKVVPPAPKPKTMSFPIDLSKYGKKSDQASPTNQVHPKKDMTKDMTGTPSTQILAPKQLRGKSDVVPDFNPSMDIRQMEYGKRVLYANGPHITVKLGETELANLPKYVFMQCSGKGYKHFIKNPDSTSITFPADSMDIDAAKTHLIWMIEMTYQGRVYSVTLNTDARFDTKNLNICRAARIMGLNNTYVGHFTKQLCDRIRDINVSIDFMEMVCALAYPENDPVFDCLANNLVNQRLRGTVKNSEEIVALVAKHENLKKKMGEIQKRVQQKHKDNHVAADAGKQQSDRKFRGASKDRKVSNGGRAEGGN